MINLSNFKQQMHDMQNTGVRIGNFILHKIEGKMATMF
jgi:hypothetical protein